jgi:exodeoxyribonuclease-1
MYLVRHLPWTVPTPGAYLTHKKIDTLQSSDTHYQMMKSIHEQWKTWSQEEPAIFITYNGHAFDEELYRKHFSGIYSIHLSPIPTEMEDRTC